MKPPPRLISDIGLPDHAFVPGRSARPENELQLAVSRPLPADFATHRWRDCRGYLYGIDLFNYGFYWEAHEAWEPVWHATERREPTCSAIKGLIKLAAAGVKVRQGSAAGRRRHASRAAALFHLAAERASTDGKPGPEVIGLSMSRLADRAQAVASSSFEASPAVASTPDDAAVPLFDFYLVPALNNGE